MNIAAMLEPVPYATMSASSVSPPQHRLPSLQFATSQHHPQQQQQKPYVSRPLPALPSLASLPPLLPQQPQLQHVDSGSSSASSVHVSTRQGPLSTHQRHQSNDYTRRESSASSSYTGATPRHRGKQTKAACIPCRKRKSKCDGFRPSCKSCLGKATPCDYSVHPGITQQQAVKNQLESYKHVLTLLRQGSMAECEVLIRQLKAHEALPDAVGFIMQNRAAGTGGSRPGA